MTESDFIFDGLKLSDFGYIIMHEGVVDDTSMVSDMSFTTIKGAKSDILRKVASPYEDTYHVDISIMKNPCQDGDLDLTNDDISTMSKWLCRKEYKWFRWIDDIGQDEIWYEVQITAEKIRYGNSIIGLTLHVNANRPYGVTQPYTFEWVGGLSNTTVFVHSDEEGYIYPDMTIKVKGGGTVVITNHYEERSTIIENCTNMETFTIKGGDMLQISTTTAKHDLSKDFNYKFFRLCNRYGDAENKITVSDNCNVSISYRGIRKVGL